MHFFTHTMLERGSGLVALESATITRNHFDDVVELLQEISVFSPTIDTFDEIWTRFSTQSNLFPRVVLSDGRVLGFGVLLVEEKIRGGRVGHIEDVVSHPDFRGLGVGYFLITNLVEIASSLGCYKVALHSQEHNVGFYEKCGFTSSGSSIQKFVSVPLA